MEEKKMQVSNLSIKFLEKNRYIFKINIYFKNTKSNYKVTRNGEDMYSLPCFPKKSYPHKCIYENEWNL